MTKRGLEFNRRNQKVYIPSIIYSIVRQKELRNMKDDREIIEAVEREFKADEIITKNDLTNILSDLSIEIQQMENQLQEMYENEEPTEEQVYVFEQMLLKKKARAIIAADYNDVYGEW
jgi:ribosome-binding ATPase YchF (GTP1/OBG family)